MYDLEENPLDFSSSTVDFSLKPMESSALPNPSFPKMSRILSRSCLLIESSMSFCLVFSLKCRMYKACVASGNAFTRANSSSDHITSWYVVTSETKFNVNEVVVTDVLTNTVIMYENSSYEYRRFLGTVPFSDLFVTGDSHIKDFIYTENELS